MNSQEKFINMIEDVTTLAKLNNREVTKEFLKDYFRDLNLNDIQMNHVYNYMAQHNIKVIGCEKSLTKIDKQKDIYKEKDEAESEYLNIYLNEVEEADAQHISMSDFNKMYDGDKASKDKIVNAYLSKVISFAQEYRSQGLSQSDLIQEGNIGLLIGLEKLQGTENIKTIENILNDSIRMAMIHSIDELSEHRKTNRNIIKRADKIKEKAEELADTMNDKMTMEEMAEYMDMDLSELEDILRITGEEL